MTDTVFHNQFWKQYILLEKEFKTSIKYVAIDSSNFSAYSDVYAKLLLQVGSEIDVVAKLLCRIINNSSSAKGMQRYQQEICMKFPEFESVIVVCGNLDINPWAGWTTTTPEWWKIYNGVKHNRNTIETYSSETKENYKFANQKNTLNALAGLYQLEQYVYSSIDHDPNEDTPLPGSRLFKLKGLEWETKNFGQDSLFYINKDGYLCYIYAETPYADI